MICIFNEHFIINKLLKKMLQVSTKYVTRQASTSALFQILSTLSFYDFWLTKRFVYHTKEIFDIYQHIKRFYRLGNRSNKRFFWFKWVRFNIIFLPQRSSVTSLNLAKYVSFFNPSQEAPSFLFLWGLGSSFHLG